VMRFDPLDGVLMGVQHVLRFKLFLLSIFVEDVTKYVVLELAELLHGGKHGHAVSLLLVVREEMYQFAVLIIMKLGELMTLKLDAV
jgi:hypothetical protein